MIPTLVLEIHLQVEFWDYLTPTDLFFLLQWTTMSND